VIVKRKTASGCHLVLAGPHARHRVVLKPACAAAQGQIILPADSGLQRRTAALSAFFGAADSAQTLASRAALYPSAFQRHRLVRFLFVLDRLDQTRTSAVTVRELAGELLDPGVRHIRAIEWKSSSCRRQAQRLIGQARLMRDGGFRDLLGLNGREFS
jgi:hypothetical protein|tara:strand:- start:4563 stop:5036 length:474 start_codon:yes stop_codon:yes gene_type:complete